MNFSGIVIDPVFYPLDRLRRDLAEVSPLREPPADHFIQIFVCPSLIRRIGVTIAEEYDIRIILNGAYEGDRAVQAIEEAKASVILGDLFDSGARIWYDSDYDRLLSHQATIPLCIGCSSGGVGKENLLWNACRLVQQGYKPADVLDLMTVKTAQILGVDDKIGSIREGLYADLAIYDGNPLESWEASIAATVVAGKVIYKKEGEAVC